MMKPLVMLLCLVLCGVMVAAIDIPDNANDNCLAPTSRDMDSAYACLDFDSMELGVVADAELDSIAFQATFTHTWIGDLQIWVVPPSGVANSVELMYRPDDGGPPPECSGCCGSSSDLDGTILLFSSEGDDIGAATAASPIPSGDYVALGDLSALNGENKAGTWTMCVGDCVSADTGSFDSFTVAFNDVEPTPVDITAIVPSTAAPSVLVEVSTQFIPPEPLTVDDFVLTPRSGGNARLVSVTQINTVRFELVVDQLVPEDVHASFAFSLEPSMSSTNLNPAAATNVALSFAGVSAELEGSRPIVLVGNRDATFTFSEAVDLVQSDFEVKLGSIVNFVSSGGALKRNVRSVAEQQPGRKVTDDRRVKSDGAEHVPYDHSRGMHARSVEAVSAIGTTFTVTIAPECDGTVTVTLPEAATIPWNQAVSASFQFAGCVARIGSQL